MAEVTNDDGTMADSLTFGQLKKIVAQQRLKPKEARYAYEHSDCDVLVEELEDWYEYSEAETMLRSSALFDEDFAHSRPWSKMSNEDKIQCIKQYAVESCYDDPLIRAKSCECLAFIAQGSYTC